MATWPHTDTPAPGRFSLTRVLAARLGHARRRDKLAAPMVTMQGRPEQGWPARRCSPETAHFIDRVREEYDADDQSQSADGVLWVYIAIIGSVIAAAVLAVAA